MPRHREIDYGLARKICKDLEIAPRKARGDTDPRGRATPFPGRNGLCVPNDVPNSAKVTRSNLT